MTPETPLKEVAEILVKHKFGSLPVTDANQLVGIITDIDLLGVLSELLEE